MAASTGAIKIEFLGRDKTLGKSFDSAWKKADTFEKKMGLVGGKMKDAGRAMTLGFTVPVVAGLTLAVKAGMEETKQMQVMSKVIRQNTGATDENIASLEEWISKQQSLSNFSDGELRPAIQALAVATKDLGEAQELTTIAMDIAAAKGLPVEQVAKALAKAHDGNIGALGRLGIATKDAEGKTLSFGEAMKRAQAAYGGAAGEARNPFTQLKNSLADLSEEIGKVLVPMVTRITEAIRPWVERFSGLSTETKSMIVTIALVVAAVGPLLLIIGKTIEIVIALKGAIVAVKGAMTALGIAGGPIFWIIGAIGLLVAAFVILYKKNETFREVVNKVWSWVKTHVAQAVSAVVTKLKEFGTWIKNVWDRSETMQKVVRKAWDLIKQGVTINARLIIAAVKLAIDIFQKAWKAGGDLKDKLVGAWNALKTKTTEIWGKIAGAVGSAKDKIVGYVNAVIRAVNWVFEKLGIDKRVSEVGASGGGGGSGAGGASTGAGAAGALAGGAKVSTPAIMDNGGTGAEGTGGGVVGAIGDWAKSMLGGLGVKWPGKAGGMFGGASSWILDAVKEAVIEVIRKSGGPGRQIVEIAKTMLGVPYLWGGTSPRGFDCSGLIYWAYQQAGRNIPRTGMWNAGRQVTPQTARPADVLFYRAGGAKQGVKYGHVKMYAGGGQTIESTSGGVQMRPADWAGAGEVRTYMRKGGVIIGGEAGKEGVLPLTDKRAMDDIVEALGGAGTYYDQRQINIIWRTQSGGVSQSDVRRLYAQINAIEGRATSAARRGSVRG